MTFLKWAGGKRQLVPKLLELLPDDIRERRYIEPMVGGGALYFALRERDLLERESILCDVNVQLIFAYHHVRSKPDEILNYLHDWRSVPYESMREAFNAAFTSGQMESCAQAARFIWLNKMCFNGIYRVNKDGLFNVPKGSRKELPELDDVIYKASASLQPVSLRIASVEDVVCDSTSSDFIYIDPPYLGDFTSYTEDGFDFGEWCRLRWVCGQLDKKKVPWMLSSNANSSVKALFEEYNITEVEAVRAINSDGTGRGAVKELVIRNYG
jgi:DNA adenine methylase